jgi:hypothetical protein
MQKAEKVAPFNGKILLLRAADLERRSLLIDRAMQDLRRPLHREIFG